MPKSRRDRTVTLSKTRKKVGLEFKQSLVDKIRKAVDDYARCFVFTVDNMRNSHLKELREDSWSHSKFFMGKNRVMSLALGRDEASEYNENLHKVSRLLRNQCGLLFTNQKKDSVMDFFTGHEQPDFARTGGEATEDVILPEGPLSQFPHSIEPQLRALGMPTALKKGVVTLLGTYTVCKKGDTLTSEQARILKLLGKQQANFRLNMVAVWNNDGKFEMLREVSDLLANDESGDEDEDGGDDSS